MMKKFNSFINENNEKSLKIKDFISVPRELEDIFHICQNETRLSQNDILISGFYSRIYFDCLMQYNGLTSGYVDIISDVRDSIFLSDNEKDAKFQFKRITNPRHIIPASLLKMLTDHKKISFVDEKLQKYHILDMMMDLIKEMFTGETHFSNNFKRQLLNSKISVN